MALLKPKRRSAGGGSRLQQRYEKEGGYATRNDVKHLERELDRNLSSGGGSGRGDSGSAQIVGKAMRMARRGFEDIGRSLGTPYDSRRPKISQLPRRKRDIGIAKGGRLSDMSGGNYGGMRVRGMNLERLRDKRFGRSLKG